MQLLFLNAKISNQISNNLVFFSGRYTVLKLLAQLNPATESQPHGFGTAKKNSAQDTP